MTDLETIKAMLERADIRFEHSTEWHVPKDGTVVLELEHDGFHHCFTSWTFNPDGSLKVITAGY